MFINIKIFYFPLYFCIRLRHDFVYLIASLKNINLYIFRLVLSFTVVKIICTLYMKGQRYKNVLLQLSKFCFCYEFLKSLIRQNKFALLIVPYGYCQTTQNVFYEKISCLCFYCVYKKNSVSIKYTNLFMGSAFVWYLRTC